MKPLPTISDPRSVKPQPFATEGRAAYLIRMCIEHHNRQGRMVESITLGRFLYQNLLDNISIAAEAKGEAIDFEEIEYNGTIIRMSMSLNSISGFEFKLSALSIN